MQCEIKTAGDCNLYPDFSLRGLDPVGMYKCAMGYPYVWGYGGHGYLYGHGKLEYSAERMNSTDRGGGMVDGEEDGRSTER